MHQLLDWLDKDLCWSLLSTLEVKASQGTGSLLMLEALVGNRSYAIVSALALWHYSELFSISYRYHRLVGSS